MSEHRRGQRTGVKDARENRTFDHDIEGTPEFLQGYEQSFSDERERQRTLPHYAAVRASFGHREGVLHAEAQGRRVSDEEMRRTYLAAQGLPTEEKR